MKNDYECMICMDPINTKSERVCKLQRKHIFHTKCIAEWFLTNQTCPICRNTNITCSHYQFHKNINSYLLAHCLGDWAIINIKQKINDKKFELQEILRQNVIVWHVLFTVPPSFEEEFDTLNNSQKFDIDGLIEYLICLTDKIHESTCINQILLEILHTNMFTLRIISNNNIFI